MRKIKAGELQPVRSQGFASRPRERVENPLADMGIEFSREASREAPPVAPVSPRPRQEAVSDVRRAPARPERKEVPPERPAPPAPGGISLESLSSYRSTPKRGGEKPKPAEEVDVLKSALEDALKSLGKE
jgi:hypothetical protein